MPWRPIRNYRATARYPSSEHQLRHIYRNRFENGLAAAFSKRAGRVLVDVDVLDGLLREPGNVDRPAA